MHWRDVTEGSKEITSASRRSRSLKRIDKETRAVRAFRSLGDLHRCRGTVVGASIDDAFQEAEDRRHVTELLRPGGRCAVDKGRPIVWGASSNSESTSKADYPDIVGGGGEAVLDAQAFVDGAVDVYREAFHDACGRVGLTGVCRASSSSTLLQCKKKSKGAVIVGTTRTE